MSNEPVVIVDSGSSYIDQEDREWMLREQIHSQQCEITALRKALMYFRPVRELSDEEIIEVHVNNPFIDGYLNKNLIAFARAILRKAQEK